MLKDATSPSGATDVRNLAGLETIGARMGGPLARQNAFDSLRLIAALSVIVSHSFILTSGNYAMEPLFWASSGQITVGTLAVGVFFVISGV